jgi:HK97 family phage major capsid protein
MAPVLIKSVAADIMPGTDPGEFTLLISDDSTDRDGEQLHAFQWKQPLPETIPVKRNHSRDVADIVGTCSPFIDDTDWSLKATGTFANTSAAQHLRQLVIERHVRGVSVEYLERSGVRELVGVAFVDIPSNVNAGVLSAKSAPTGGTMSNIFAEQLTELEAEFGKRCLAGDLSRKEAEEFEKRADDLRVKAQNLTVARTYADAASPEQFGLGSTPDPRAAAFTSTRHTKSVSGPKNPYAASPLDATESDWHALFSAAQAKMPSFAITVKAEGFNKAAGDLRTKDTPNFTVEGAAGSLLPPTLIPAAFRLQYEPDRVWQHLPGMPMDSQSIAYLQHSANANPAAITAETVAFPDLGMTIVEKTALATKIGATATFSRELLDDFSDFMGFVPSEISRATIDAETNYVVNDGSAGLLSVADTLKRTASSSPTPIDALLAGINDIRVGTSYARADLVILHPTTWLDVRSTRGTTGMYVLRQNEPSDVLGETLDSFFGVRVVQNTKVPLGTAIILDTAVSTIAFTRMGLEIAVNWMGDSVFSTFGYQWRVAERIALGVIRPSAICIVTGLPYVAGGNPYES